MKGYKSAASWVSQTIPKENHDGQHTDHILYPSVKQRQTFSIIFL